MSTNTTTASNGVTLASTASPAGPTAQGKTVTPKPIFGHTDPESIKEAEAFVADIQKMGREEGTGKAARLKFFLRVTTAAVENIIAEKDAREVYTSYATACAEQALKRGEVYTMSEGTSLAAQAAKLNRFIRLGVALNESVADGNEFQRADEFLYHALEVRAAHIAADPDGKALAPYEFLYNVARAQLEALDAVREDKMLTDRELIDICSPSVADRPEFDEAEALMKQVTALGNIRDGSKPDKEGNVQRPACPSDEIDAAIEWLETRIVKINPEYVTRADQAARAAAAAALAEAEKNAKKGRRGKSRAERDADTVTVASMHKQAAMALLGIKPGSDLWAKIEAQK